MKLSAFKNELSRHAGKPLQFVLPTGSKVPIHAHVTDVARIDKRFIDCGGTIRTESVCRLQVWFADDTDHRITAGTLLKVLDKAASIIGADDLDVDIEYEAPFISQFPTDRVEAAESVFQIHLGVRHTTCLAQDVCLPPPAGKKSFTQYPGLPALQTSKCC